MVGTNVVPEKDVSEFTFSFAAKLLEITPCETKESYLSVFGFDSASVLYAALLWVVPLGASLEPLIGYSRELKRINSPQGKMYRVFVNDAGAMHSGNRWVWAVDHGWISGR